MVNAEELINKKLSERKKEFEKALEKQKKDPEYLYEEVQSIEILIRFEISLIPQDEDTDIIDGLYIYMDEIGKIIDVEYYIKVDDEITVTPVDDETLELVTGLFKDAFTLEVD
ncbi:MAG: hypothetical protein Q4Q23_05155 [Methanobacteriaceae archaeon]|nr:hypothetical protein [Methanobacteriaceae archaeon]